MSLPSRGAWIEISTAPAPSLEVVVAPLAGSVDRNIQPTMAEDSYQKSLPSRGAWIEILLGKLRAAREMVAPLAGSVDRNLKLVKPGPVLMGRSPRGERG